MKTDYLKLTGYGRSYWRSVIAVWLLVIYAAGTISVDLLHHVVHDDTHSESHSEVAEQDPCHTTLFHNNKTTGCDHKTHVTAPPKCKYSHVVFKSLQVIVITSPAKEVLSGSPVQFVYRFFVIESTRHTQPLRGPPVA